MEESFFFAALKAKGSYMKKKVLTSVKQSPHNPFCTESLKKRNKHANTLWERKRRRAKKRESEESEKKEKS